MTYFVFRCTRCDVLVAVICSHAKHMQFKAWCRQCNEADEVNLISCE